MRKSYVRPEITALLAAALWMLTAMPANAGHWLINVSNTANTCTTLYDANNSPISTWSSSWQNNLRRSLIPVGPQQCSYATFTCAESFTITLTWSDANGAPPPTHLNYLVSGDSDWRWDYFDDDPPGDPVDGSKCATDDGLRDPYTVAFHGGKSSGTHLVQIDNPGSTVTFGASMSIDLTLSATNMPYQVDAGDTITVCLLTDLDPFPDNLANSDPVVLYHGTTLDQANFLAADTTNIAALGGVDFGAGFYTMDSTAFDMAKLFAERARDYHNAPWWGVAEFDVPLTMMLDFFCQYQDFILGYQDKTDTASPASWNSPYFPNDVPEPNFTPNQNPANTPIPTGQINWTNFCWYNYWYDLCILGNPAPTGVGTGDYVPDWSTQAVHYDWGYAMIWGNFYKGPWPDCNDYRRGNLFTGRLGVAYQYVWCTNGGVDLFNERDANGKPLVRRSVIKQPGAP